MEALNLAIEELEPRIAPSGFGPSNNGNPGNEVSNGASPQPSGGGSGGCAFGCAVPSAIRAVHGAMCRVLPTRRGRSDHDVASWVVAARSFNFLANSDVRWTADDVAFGVLDAGIAAHVRDVHDLTNQFAGEIDAPSQTGRD